jgi:hypothetical protein
MERINLMPEAWVDAPIITMLTPEEVSKPDPLQFPPGLMTGFAGNVARVYSALLEPPAHFFYVSALTTLGSILSGKITLQSELRRDPRMYTLLLGESGTSRKSTAITTVVDLFLATKEASTFRVSYGVGSAEGLQQTINARGWDKRLLLFLDEFKPFVSKCKIEGSVLLPCVNTLFESNKYENVIKGKTISLFNTHFSILAASTIDTYSHCWDSTFTDIGFNNRLFIVPGQSVRSKPLPASVDPAEYMLLKEELSQIIAKTAVPMVYSMDSDALEYYEAWYMGLPQSIHAVRLDSYAARLMPLLAANDQKDTIDIETTMKATTLCDWQLKVRQQYDPIDADTKTAKMEERIRRVLLNGKKLKEYQIRAQTNAHRVGLFVFKQSLQNLRDAGEVEMLMDKTFTLAGKRK